MNPDDDGTESIAQRIYESIGESLIDYVAAVDARRAAEEDERDVRRMVAELESTLRPLVTLEEWQVQVLERYYGLGPDGQTEYKGFVYAHPRRNGRAVRFREFLRQAGFGVPDPPAGEEQTAEPVSEEPRERALRLRRERNTGPTHTQRSPRRIDPRGHR